MKPHIRSSGGVPRVLDRRGRPHATRRLRLPPHRLRRPPQRQRPAARRRRPTSPTTASDRRDPFVSLVQPWTEAKAASSTPLQRPDGIAGVLVDEVGGARHRPDPRRLGGHDRRAANGRLYTVRPGDRLMDGTCARSTRRRSMLMQEVKDPLSLEKQREVRKQLRGEVK